MPDDLVSIKLPPGFFRNGTEYEAQGRWFDGNLVRWENNRLKPWCGWLQVLADGVTLTGVPRGGLAWLSNNAGRFVTFGTASKLYVSSDGINYSDSTPVGFTTGNTDGSQANGYGAGPYGGGPYGQHAASSSLVLDADIWNFDLYGEDLLGVFTADGHIYEWQPGVGGLATILTNAPTGNRSVLVTDQEYIFALGAGSVGRKVQWNNGPGGPTDWTISPTTLGGSRVLKTKGTILTGRVWNGVPIIFTNADVHAMPYLGPPFVYDNYIISESAGLIGPNAVAGNSERLVWMGYGHFWQYNGVVQDLPCEVNDFLWGSASPGINLIQRAKIYCTHNQYYKEFTWFYPDASSIENNRYITWNYDLNIWYFGQLTRTTWLDRRPFDYPLATDASGNIWEHDVAGNFLANGAPRSGIFAQSGPAEIGKGDRVAYCNLMLPDVFNGSNVQLKMVSKMGPQDTGVTSQTYGPFNPTSLYVPTRFAGRQVATRIEQINDGDWSMGNTRLKVAAWSKR
jgi:hypothetical protein